MVKVKRSNKLHIIFLILSILLLYPLFLKAESLKVYDQAMLFTQEEINQLNEETNSLIKDYNMDIIIVTTDDADGLGSRAYADDFYDENKFGIGKDLDGVLFLIDMDNGEVHISTKGLSIKYLTDQRLKTLIENILNSIGDDQNYYGASQVFLQETSGYFKQGIPKGQTTVDENNNKKNSLSIVDSIIGTAGGLLSSGLFFFRTKSKYKMEDPIKPVRFRDNSKMSLITNENRMLDTVVTRQLISKIKSEPPSNQSTTHKSSSGQTHGGAGGKFK